jgi:3-isopropylmalate dehydrogenase
MAYRIAVIAGDGIGPEVTTQALKVVDAAAERFGFGWETIAYDLGGTRYETTGELLPDSVLGELADTDAILVGAVGTPTIAPGILERGLLLHLRFEFDQYVNLRPVRLLPGVETPIAGLTPERCDYLVVRENTEGLYSGIGGVLYRGTTAEVASQDSVNTRFGVERVVRYAFEQAVARDVGVTLCHKTNVLTHAGDLWQRTVDEVSAEYPDTATDYAHVDAACLYLVTSPERFGVIVTDNMFGDIITDLAAATQGGMGFAASGNINPRGDGPSMFEPVHGSAPDMAGKGTANPVASILSVSMCLAHLGELEAAGAIEEAVAGVLSEGVRGAGVGSRATDETGDAIRERLSTTEA